MFHDPLPDFCAAADQAARVALAERQLARVADREEVVQAFVRLDVHAARRRLGSVAGPLGAALLAVKDVIATAEFPTACGADTAPADAPWTDAWCVGAARRLGALVLGKAVCTKLAFPIPGPTTNPHDPTRSPGGSSSGSAAAVAAGFVSFALGTQTAGSTIRPASYCGIVGYKPTFGLVPMIGIEPIAPTLDHVGVLARSPRDAWYFTSALLSGAGEIAAPRRPEKVLMPRLPAALTPGDGYPERLDALERALRQAGIAVERPPLPFPVEDYAGLQQTICYWEAARLFASVPEGRLWPDLLAQLAPYRAMPIANYLAARQRCQAYQQALAVLAAGADAILLPAADGSAPRSLATTGDPIMSRLWTALHVPAMTVPAWRADDSMPLGLQLLGAFGRDQALAETAQWFHEEGLGR